MEGQPKKRNLSRKKIAVLLGAVLLVLLTVTLILNRDRLTFGHITRAIQYRNLGSASLAEDFRFASLGSNTFAVLDDGIAVASGSGLAFFDRAGREVYAAQASMQQPVIETEGSFALAYDLGGLDILVGNTREVLRHKEADGRIIDARINENGWVTVSSEQIGTLGVVHVYDAQGQARLRVLAGDGHLIAAALAADNRTLITLTMTETGGRVAWFCADVGGDPQHVHLEEDELFFDLWFTARDGAVGVISSNMVRFLSNTGELTSEYLFPDLHLRAYDTYGGRAGLHLSPFRTGAGGTLAVLEPNGSPRETLAEGTVIDISLRGRFLAVLYFNRLDTYRNGRAYASWDDTEGMTRVLMREDGTVFRLSPQRARLLVP